jgi:hypothetical protein
MNIQSYKYSHKIQMNIYSINIHIILLLLLGLKFYFKTLYYVLKSGHYNITMRLSRVLTLVSFPPIKYVLFYS